MTVCGMCEPGDECNRLLDMHCDGFIMLFVTRYHSIHDFIGLPRQYWLGMRLIHLRSRAKHTTKIQ